ncbi:MAG: amidohydrolase, partial [Planctomycetota bacterium]
NLRSAIRHGLSESQALAALTTAPAELLGLSAVMGTIEEGKVANLVVVKGSLFEKKKPTIRDVWVNGRRHEISREDARQLVASGTLRTDLGTEHAVSIDTEKKAFAIEHGEEKLKAKKVIVQPDRVSVVVDGGPFAVEGLVRLSGVVSGDELTGSGALPDGRRFSFSFEGTGELTEEAVAAEPADAEEPGEARERAAPGIDGEWSVTFLPEMSEETVPALISLQVDDGGAVSGTVFAMEQEIPIEEGTFDTGTGSLELQVTGPDGEPVTISASVEEDRLEGRALAASFNADVRGSRAGAPPKGDGDGDDDAELELPPEELLVPIGAYGLDRSPVAEDVVVEHATIWTCGPAGIIEDGAMLVRNGRIEAIYKDSPVVPEGVRRIDARGKHVTPGLIDCHSHTGIDGGVNEFAQTNTAEVRIGDMIDPDDINWYRQLAGGLTAANQLHGSANPIGGQNSVVKLKWGGTADDFRVDDAIAGIKFALGENVKRSENRYPDTRMGVETFIRDAFTAADDYRESWRRYESLPTERRRRTMPPRRDLELDTLVEIIEGDRLVHCHSYRQDEILMLIRLADHFGFTIGTFQHVLEGYKVADAIAKHGAGGSSFSDWWAYKMEVMDAIPHNGALMTEVGVVVSFNSDSSELARRMNTEAAKAVRYGGVDPHEALKFVTLNPAKQLRIDHRTGSLEPGKDADFVIWSDSPLSTYARCEQTWIEGARYFDIEAHQAIRERDVRERQRLVQKILAQSHGSKEKRGEGDGDKPTRGESVRGRPTRLMARMLEQQRAWMEEQVRLGHDPEEIRPGRCACNDVWWWMMNSERMLGEHMLEEAGQ